VYVKGHSEWYVVAVRALIVYFFLVKLKEGHVALCQKIHSWLEKSHRKVHSIYSSTEEEWIASGAAFEKSQEEDELHLSLSRVVFLKYSQIEQCISLLQKEFQASGTK
jgi:hypothetical protein